MLIPALKTFSLGNNWHFMLLVSDNSIMLTSLQGIKLYCFGPGIVEGEKTHAAIN